MLFPVSLSSLFFLLVTLRRADAVGVSFTKPAPGGTYPPAGFDVAWVDGGGSPDMSQLDTYTLQLIVGGNTPQDSKVLATIGNPNSSVATGHVTDDLPSNITQSIENGFYLIMTSNTTAGDQVINYSDRFTLNAVDGTTPSLYLDAANAQAGSPTNVPGPQYNLIAPPAPSSTPIASQTPTPRPRPTSSTTQAPTQEASEDDNYGLSDGALTGLIIGAVFALVGLVSLLLWAYMLGKKIRQKKQAAKDIRRARISKAFVDGKAELPADSVSSAELAGSNTELSPYPSEASPYAERFEAPGWAKVAEAPGSTVVHELEGDWSGWEAGSGRKSRAYDSAV